MAKEKIFVLFDGRYLTDQDRAICYEVCNTLKEAKSSARDYGTDTVIVEAELNKNKFILGNIVR